MACRRTCTAFVGCALLIKAQGAAIRGGQPISSEPTNTILDKVTVGGIDLPISEYGNTCQEVAPTSELTVCGCKWKATAYLLTECGSGGNIGYSDYEVDVGSCDCAQSGCVSQTLSSGYTSNLEVCGCKWKATAYLMTECGSGGNIG